MSGERYTVETKETMNENYQWLFCFGTSCKDNKEYRICVNDCSSTEIHKYAPDAKDDAKRVANLLNNEQELKQIVEAVAEKAKYVNPKGNNFYATCEICGSGSSAGIKNIPHQKECVVSKARKLLKEIWGG